MRLLQYMEHCYSGGCDTVTVGYVTLLQWECDTATLDVTLLQ